MMLSLCEMNEMRSVIYSQITLVFSEAELAALKDKLTDHLMEFSLVSVFITFYKHDITSQKFRHCICFL